MVRKIYEAQVLKENSNFEPGYIMDVSNDGIKVSTGSGVLLIKKIQFPSKKPMYVKDYIKGNTINTGLVLC